MLIGIQAVLRHEGDVEQLPHPSACADLVQVLCQGKCVQLFGGVVGVLVVDNFPKRVNVTPNVFRNRLEGFYGFRFRMLAAIEEERRPNQCRFAGRARIQQFQSEFLREGAHFGMRAVNELTAQLGGQPRSQYIFNRQDASAGPFRRFINLRPQARLAAICRRRSGLRFPLPR